MPLEEGGGRYEAEVQALHDRVGAEATVLIVGHKDPQKCGFSIGLRDGNPAILLKLSIAMRTAADKIDKHIIDAMAKHLTEGDDESDKEISTDENRPASEEEGEHAGPM